MSVVSAQGTPGKAVRLPRDNYLARSLHPVWPLTGRVPTTVMTRYIHFSIILDIMTLLGLNASVRPIVDKADSVVFGGPQGHPTHPFGVLLAIEKGQYIIMLIAKYLHRLQNPPTLRVVTSAHHETAHGDSSVLRLEHRFHNRPARLCPCVLRSCDRA